MRSRLKYRKGLKLDSSEWQIVRDNYSLLDPTHDLPRHPRFSLSSEPFLIVTDRFGSHGFTAGVQRDDKGCKVWWLAWLRDREEQGHMCVDSLQEVLFYIDDALHQIRRIEAKQKKRTK